MTTADWIAVDWGTTHLRAWAMQGRVAVEEVQSDRGMNALAPAEFEPALVRLVDDWLDPRRTTIAVCCGMVGSRQGWTEALYVKVPCPAFDGGLTKAKATDPRLAVHVVPGLSQASPPDVMRGEETQIAGFLSLNEGWDGVLCLPGTHSKWAHVSAGEVVSFQTFMTGEMFALLSRQSVLRHSTAGDGWDREAFAQALDDAMARPESLAARLFRLRAAHLLEGTDAGTTRAQLSGLLIGAELAAARPYWLGQQVAVIGAEPLATTYVTALASLSVAAIHADAKAMTLAGLIRAHRTLTGSAQ